MEVKLTNHKLQALSLSWDGSELVDWVVGFRLNPATGDVTSEPGLDTQQNSITTSTVGPYCITEGLDDEERLVLKNGRPIRRLQGSGSGPFLPLHFRPGFELLKNNGRVIVASVTESRLVLEDPEGTWTIGGAPGARCPYFHGALRANAEGSRILDLGWVWHPFKTVFMHSLPEVFKDPSLLEGTGTLRFDAFLSECVDAAWVNDKVFLAYAWGEEVDEALEFTFEDVQKGLRHGSIGAWNVELEKWIFRRPLMGPPGKLRPLGGWIIEADPFLKVLNVRNGKVVWEDESIIPDNAEGAWAISQTNRAVAFTVEGIVHTLVLAERQV